MAIKKADVPHVTDYLKDIMEFLDTGWNGAEVTCEGVPAKSVYHGIKRVLRTKPEKTKGVNCVLRKGRVYLMRVKNV